MRRTVPNKLAIIVPTAIALLCSCKITESQAATLVLYVATDGNDSWSGHRPKPNSEKTDGPFATLERARDCIRLKKAGGELPTDGVTVEIQGGLYERAATFTLTAADSGTENAPIVYRGARGHEVRISGGRTVTDFRPVDDAAVLRRIDQQARGNVLQADLKALGITDLGQVSSSRLELFFNDEPMTLARWPNDGFVQIADLVGGEPVNVRGTKGDKIGKFMYEGDRPKRWADENDAWVHGYWFWDWSDQRHRIESIDTERRIISVVPPYHGYGYRKGQWFYAFNLLAELDRPGQWYLDRQSSILYFWPPSPVEEGRVVVSITDNLVTMQDTSYVTLQNLTLEAARGTAVIINGGTQNRVARCTARNLGGCAVRIQGGKTNGVETCNVYGLGNGGIVLSGGDRQTLTPASHHATDNHIHHYGRWNRMYQAGVSLRGVGHRVAHNLIHDAPHQAVSFSGNDHHIELNEIHHVCLESNDAGAIYSGRDWTMRGTVIRHNFMHHVTGFRDRGCVGVYLDDMFCGTNIHGNVFYKVTRAAFIGGGRDCRVENNVFVDCNPALHIDARAMSWAGYHVNTTMKQRLDAMPIRTPTWSKRYPELLTLWDDEPAAPKGNIVARNVSWGGRWDGVHGQARPFVSFEDNLVDEDPRFVDPQSMNFQVQDDSPVHSKIPGFERIPFEKIGIRSLREDKHSQPNILLIVTDDQRPDTIHALGNDVIRTPTLDGLVRDGLTFTRAIVANPLCVPSRAEIMTGCDGFRNGVGVLGGRLDPKLKLWAQAMRDGGYFAWYVGKWMNDGRPINRGYDETLGLFASGGARWAVDGVDYHGREITGYRGWVFQSDSGTKFPDRGVGLTPDISRHFADAAIKFIRRQPDRPFFLHLNFTAPHDPLLMPPGYEGVYDPMNIPLPPSFLPRHPFDHGNLEGRDELLLPFPRTANDVREDLAVYYAVISHMDEHIGRILTALDETNQANRTIVIFTSDHGLAMGSHGLRGKQNMYDHTVGVPLVFRGPGIPRGAKAAAQCYLRDLYPTVCDLAGIEIPETVQGRSLAPVIRGESAAAHPYVFGYFRDCQRMIRTDRWKLIHYPQINRTQLFDLVADPNELDDRSQDPACVDILQELRTRLSVWRKEVRDPVVADETNVSE